MTRDTSVREYGSVTVTIEVDSAGEVAVEWADPAVIAKAAIDCAYLLHTAWKDRRAAA